jgi:hypothetical protein
MNIKMLKTVFAGLVMITSGFSQAGIITLDFEGVGDLALVDNFYNGGTDSLGNSGENYGISFGSGALGCIDSDAGGSCNIANEPTADTIMFFADGNGILDFSAGFDTGLSFFYTSSLDTTIKVYSGLNLTGTLLGSIDISNNHQGNNCVGDPNGQFCNWDIGSLNFSGTAYSIDFGGTFNSVAFDNLTFGSANPGTEVPEPSTLAIFALGMIGLASRRFKKQS